MNLLVRLVILCFIAITAAEARQTIKFPEANPAFSFTVPDDWTKSLGENGKLDCKAGDETGYTLSIIPLRGMANITSEVEVKSYLVKLAESMARNAKITGLDVGDMQEMTNIKDVRFFGLNATGKQGTTEMIVSVVAFAAEPDTYFVLAAASTAIIDKSKEWELNEIIDSITPLSAKAAE
jgi:hypothetical protein